MLNECFTSVHRKSIHLCRELVERGSSLCKSSCNLIWNSYYFLLLHVESFWFQVWYFFFVSLLGFLILKTLKPRSSSSSDNSSSTRNLDLFFTAISATTVSSMSTVEMEVFSNSQLIILTILMLVGGEVFTSMIGLRFKGSKLRRPWETKSRINVLEQLPSNFVFSSSNTTTNDGIGTAAIEMSENVLQKEEEVIGVIHEQLPKCKSDELIIIDPFLRYRSIKLLGQIVSIYFVVVQVMGIVMVIAYLTLSSSASTVLKHKGLEMSTFSIFTVISTFASCGFVPTNENMIIFRKNSGLLLILIPQMLLGNTLFPSCLRLLIWAFGKLNGGRDESDYLLRNTRDYLHLLPRRHSWWLVYTVFGFIGVQFVVFCSVEWDSVVLSGLSVYEKLVAGLFQCVNSRHTGETIVDLSAVAPVVLVLFVAMMYFPPYTAVIPSINTDESEEQDGQRTSTSSTGKKLLDNLLFSQLSYLLIFTLVLCVSEKESLKKDPLNFNFLNIVVEVISAYGNVGFSTGYSCARRLNQDGLCVDKSYGFSGKWTAQGKITLIFVMIFGRLKKYNMQGGKPWKLM